MNFDPRKPHLERNLIGCLCVDAANTLFEIEQHGLTDDSFTDPKHRQAFKVARELVGKGDVVVDENSLASALEDRGMEDAVEYCREVFKYGQNLSAIGAYAKLIADAHMRRNIKLIAAKLEEEADNPEFSVEEVKAHAEDGLLSISSARREVSWSEAAETRLSMWMEARDRANAGDTATIGIPFVSDGLNRLLGGARRGRLTIVAAPEKSGKTIWWGNEAVGQARNGYKVGAWCGEMTADEIVGRSAARDARVSSFHLDAGYATDYQINSIAEMLREIGKLPIVMSDDPMNIDELCSWIRRAVAKDGIQIMYVDHLDLIDGVGSDYERVSNSVKRLRELAMQLDLPIVLLHQLSRKYEHENRAPDVRDLRDSGKVSHNAYSVSIFYQDKFEQPCDETKIIWRVCLNRGGPIGMCLFDRNFDIQEMKECSRLDKLRWQVMKGIKTQEELDDAMQRSCSSTDSVSNRSSGTTDDDTRQAAFWNQ